MQKNFKRDDKFSKWQLQEQIGTGGNGEVWKAVSADDSSKIVAIKLLTNIKRAGYTRFRDEVKVLKENKDIAGLLPVIDCNLPKGISHSTPWFTMPLATPLRKCLDGKSPEQIIDITISVAKILAKLHDRNISHRDIKPANILVKDGIIFLCDFGLVDYPTKVDITPNRKDVGPHWTIAPEMKRNPASADGKSADVYSLAKTLWILLTKETKGFEGQYSVGSTIEIRKYVPSIYNTPLDDLLYRSTDHEPSNRPNISEFLNELNKWKELNKDFQKRSKLEWVDIQKKLFPSAMPKTVVWEDINDIVNVLNTIGEHDRVHHTFLPQGGGLDLEGAKMSLEEGCIELTLMKSAHIVKPIKLTFESFPNNSDWNYFRLDTGGLSFLGNDHTEFEEPFTEIEPYVYTNINCARFDDFNGERLPTTARVVYRIVKGAFLICLRTGIYNRDTSTYDGRHNEYDTTEFRGYIEHNIQSLEEAEEKAKSEDRSPSKFQKPQLVESTKVRKGNRNLGEDEIRLINQVIDLYKEVKKEHAALLQRVGLSDDIIILTPQKRAELAKQSLVTEQPNRDKFRVYLQSLHDNELLIIEAVMYGGRETLTSGRARPFDEMLEYFKDDPRESAIHSILEKEPLDNYLAAGIEAYK